MKKILALLILLALTGCYTPETVCQNYGAVPGIPAFVQCMATLQAGDDKSWGLTGR